MSNHVTFINRIVRWILPLLAVLLIAMYLVLSPAMFTHAAAPTHHNIVVPHQSAPEANPEMYWPY